MLVHFDDLKHCFFSLYFYPVVFILCLAANPRWHRDPLLFLKNKCYIKNEIYTSWKRILVLIHGQKEKNQLHLLFCHYGLLLVTRLFCKSHKDMNLPLIALWCPECRSKGMSKVYVFVPSAILAFRLYYVTFFRIVSHIVSPP